MKTQNIQTLTALALLTLGATACSDNLDSVLEPVSTPRQLSLTVDGQTIREEGTAKSITLDLQATPGSRTVKVASNTLWVAKVENCTGGWCSVNVYEGRGDGEFTISVLDNMQERRKCNVNVYNVDAKGEAYANDNTLSVILDQAVSDVRLSPSTLQPFPAREAAIQKFNITSNVSWTLEVEYDGVQTTGYIDIVPDDSAMVPDGNGNFSGDGDATFQMRVSDNNTATERKAFLNLRSDVSNYTVEIRQNGSDYTFDVSPSETQIVEAGGGTIEFGVLSLSDWSIKSSDALDSWVTFSRMRGEAGSTRETTVATVAPNTTGRERTATIVFEPDDPRYRRLSVEIVQRGYDAVFTASRSDVETVVMEDGGSLHIELDSRFRWTSSGPSWLSIYPGSGGASEVIQNIEVGVEQNLTNATREGTLTLTPLPTEFEAGVTVDPAALNIGALHFVVTQFGGREPAISVPWLRDDYTQTSATVEFNYYSPFYGIVEAGLEWMKEEGSGAGSMKVTPSGSKEGTVSFSIAELAPATLYVARGYVRDELGNVKYGKWSYPFRTAGQYPGGDDNPTPSR